MQIFNWLFYFSLSWLLFPNSFELSHLCEEETIFFFADAFVMGDEKVMNCDTAEFMRKFPIRIIFMMMHREVGEWLRNGDMEKPKCENNSKENYSDNWIFRCWRQQNRQSEETYKVFLSFPCLCFVRKTAKIFYFVPGGFSFPQVCTFESIWSIWPSSHPRIIRSSSSDDFVCNKNIFASRRIAEIIYDKQQRKANRRWGEDEDQMCKYVRVSYGNIWKNVETKVVTASWNLNENLDENWKVSRTVSDLLNKILYISESIQYELFLK